jgi:hypothetical protein
LARFFLRLQEAGRVLAASADDVLAFDDLETARYEAERGAKDLLIECIRTGRDPSGDAVDSRPQGRRGREDRLARRAAPGAQ